MNLLICAYMHHMPGNYQTENFWGHLSMKDWILGLYYHTMAICYNFWGINKIHQNDEIYVLKNILLYNKILHQGLNLNNDFSFLFFERKGNFNVQKLWRGHWNKFTWDSQNFEGAGTIFEGTNSPLCPLKMYLQRAYVLSLFILQRVHYNTSMGTHGASWYLYLLIAVSILLSTAVAATRYHHISAQVIISCNVSIFVQLQWGCRWET